MNLRHYCFDTEIYEELEQKKLKGIVCFEDDIKKKVLEFEKEILLNIKLCSIPPESCMDKYNLKELLNKYKEVFGDWRK